MYASAAAFIAHPCQMADPLDGCDATSFSGMREDVDTLDMPSRDLSDLFVGIVTYFVSKST